MEAIGYYDYTYTLHCLYACVVRHNIVRRTYLPHGHSIPSGEKMREHNTIIGSRGEKRIRRVRDVRAVLWRYRNGKKTYSTDISRFPIILCAYIL